MAHSKVVDTNQSTRQVVPYGDDIQVWAIFTKPAKRACPRRGFLLLAGGFSPRRLRKKVLQNLDAPPEENNILDSIKKT